MDSRTPKRSSSRSRPASARPRPDTATREERKQKTRQALLDAATHLLEEQSFQSIGIREITREAGVVPSAFYRHFASTEELGLVLIDDAFRTLRQMLRAARSDPTAYDDAIKASATILSRHVREHRAQFRLIARERFSGVAVLRHVIQREIELFASELATDLSRFPFLETWTTEDLQMAAGLIVNTAVTTAEALLEAGDDAEAQAEITRLMEKQLRLIVVGVPNWRSG